MSELIILEKVIKIIEGTAIPKPANDQNTDDIVPARYLKEITFANMGEYAYHDERFKDGITVQDHPFNDTKYQGGNILIAGANYGCGSSREHAPQALMRYGIKGIIAESFAEIFAGNCASLGIVGVTAPSENISDLVELVQEFPEAKFKIDLNNKSVLYKYDTAEIDFFFEIPEGRRQSFLNGTWDAMAVLQRDEEGIKRVEEKLPYLHFK